MNEEKMFAYKFLKPVLGVIYKLWFNPKIIGKENIPKEGSILVVGNHIHMMDQCNVILATKRPLHYMAKKEYFEGRFAWFFKAVGCIPVDRSRKDNGAVEAALEVLHNNQALGLFPEGTRNGMKDEHIKRLYEEYISDDVYYEEFYKKVKKSKTSQVNYLEELMESKVITRDEFIDNLGCADEFLNDLIINHRLTRDEYYDHILLPFKFGAVSMASRTDSYLVPYAITGDYKFRSHNLVIRIGKAFKADADLEKANQRLTEEIKNLIKENLQK